MTLLDVVRIDVILNQQSQTQITVRLIHDERCIGKKMNLVYAQKIRTFARHWNGAAVRSVIVKSVAVLAHGHLWKREPETIVSPRVVRIDIRVVGKVKQHDQMPVAPPLGPDAIRFR